MIESSQKSRKIKRYQNRKLYDTVASCYITLSEMCDLIREGEDVIVIDNVTKKYITDEILLSAIVQEEKISNIQEHTALLKRVICSFNGKFTTYIKELEHEVGFFTEKGLPEQDKREATQYN